MTIKTVVLDFDGVVTARGEFAKEAAWDKLLASRLESAEARVKDTFTEVLSKNRRELGGGKGKGDRNDILRETLRVVGCSEAEIPMKVSHYSNMYNEEVQKLILEGGLSNGAIEALEVLWKRVPLYLNSATPEAPLKDIVEKLGVQKFFTGIFGRPRGKDEILRHILALTKARPDELLFVGDGEGDVRAARAVGCRFVGFGNDWNRWVTEKEDFPVITRLGELTSYI